MARHAAPHKFGRRRGRTATAAVFAIVGLGVTGTGVIAALNATAFNTSAQDVTSGTLKLELDDNGDGFSQDIVDMAPGDVVNRFVDVSNTGTLDGKNLTLSVASSTNTKLTNDATNGLHVTVTSCSTSWDPTTGANGTCTGGGSTSVVANNVALSALISSPTTLISGAVTDHHYRLALALPDQTETTTNGTLPGSTIQGLTASLTWTFTETQRDATTTTS